MRSQKRLVHDKKGSVFDLIVFSAIAFIFIMIIILVIKVSTTVDDSLGSMVRQNPSMFGPTINATLAYEQTYGEYVDALRVYRWGGAAIIITMALSILITSFLARRHPVFLVIYIFIWIIAIIISVPISNAYESVHESAALHGSFDGFTATDNIFLYLHIWVIVIGGLAGILNFIGVIYTPNQGGGLL